MKAAPEQVRWRRRYALVLAGLACSVAAHADWVIDSGWDIDMAGGSTTLGCTDLIVRGTLTVGAGGSITDVRNVVIEPGGNLQLAGGLIELSSQWTNQGQFDAGGGQVVRVDSGTCPAAGPLGPVATGAAGAALSAIPTVGAAALSGLAALLAALGWRAQGRATRRRSTKDR